MNILEQIVSYKKLEIAEINKKFSVSDFKSMRFFYRRTVSLRESLNETTPFAIIAEIKRSSPSAGTIRKNASPSEIGKDYENNGAAGISVLTDERYFSGSVKDLSTVRESVELPLLRKEFIIDPIQLYEAKAFGADAVLLIASLLEKNQMKEFHQIAVEIGLECLVELYDEQEIEKLDFDTMKLIGINNRDLKTLTIDLKRSVHMATLVPDDCTLISESGIHSPDNIQQLIGANIRAALIGEHFMKSGNPGIALRQLLESV